MGPQPPGDAARARRWGYLIATAWGGEPTPPRRLSGTETSRQAYRPSFPSGLAQVAGAVRVAAWPTERSRNASTISITPNTSSQNPSTMASVASEIPG